jgi:lysophospholipase L1-like esterase
MKTRIIPVLTFVLRGLLYLVYISVCIEVALQGFYYVTAGDFLFRRIALPIFAPDPYAGFGNRPGLSFDHRTNEFRARYITNQAGFRVPRPDLEYTLAKPSDTYRIMLLGASFAFGWGVDYELSFARVLQHLLQKGGFAGKKKIEIINAGVPAMTMATQLSWFERVGKGYVPDLVIQLEYGTMLEEWAGESYPLAFAAVDDDGYLVRWINAVARFERFKSFATIFYGWILWAKLNTVRAGEPSGAVLGAGREIPVAPDFEPTHPAVLEAMHVFNKLGSIVRQTGAQVLVVYAPLSYEIHEEDKSRWRHLGLWDVQRQMTFNAAFVRYLNEYQIPSVDITQQLQKSAQAGKRMYFWLDIHWTPAGNATAAQAVAGYLLTATRSRGVGDELEKRTSD